MIMRLLKNHFEIYNAFSVISKIAEKDLYPLTKFTILVISTDLKYYFSPMGEFSYQYYLLLTKNRVL